MSNVTTQIRQRTPISFVEQVGWDSLHDIVNLMDEYRTLRGEHGDKHPRVNQIRGEIMETKVKTEDLAKKVFSRMASVILIWRILGKYNAEMLHHIIEASSELGNPRVIEQAVNRSDKVAELEAAVTGMVKDLIQFFGSAMDNAEDIVRSNLESHPKSEDDQTGCDCPNCRARREGVPVNVSSEEAVTEMVAKALGIDPSEIKAFRIG